MPVAGNGVSLGAGDGIAVAGRAGWLAVGRGRCGAGDASAGGADEGAGGNTMTGGEAVGAELGRVAIGFSGSAGPAGAGDREGVGLGGGGKR